MNILNSLALAVVVLLAPSTLADRFYNSFDQEYNSLSESTNTIRCVSGDDCGPNQCSVMGMQRYSEPECRARGELGEPCRMYADEPENKTLHFPHVTMECQDVYMQFCPCASGLVCREAQCQLAGGSSVPQIGEPELEEDEQQVQSGFPTNYGSSWGQYQNRRPFPWALGRFH